MYFGHHPGSHVVVPNRDIDMQGVNPNINMEGLNHIAFVKGPNFIIFVEGLYPIMCTDRVNYNLHKE
jgi:hypothetical protein